MTVFIATRTPELIWLLPGVWSILCSLGLFASGGLLPKPIYLVACYYLSAGVYALMYDHSHETFSSWTMIVTFGIGQLLVAGVLYWCLERKHEA